MIRPFNHAVLLVLALLATAPGVRAQDVFFADGFEVDASTQIAVARATPDGPANVAIGAALVTFLKPALGTDPAGFFLQGAAAGPALFVAIDPALVSPPAAVGDRVSLTVTTMATVAGMRRATAITGYVRDGTGVPVAPLVQDLSTRADVVTGLDGYDSELVSITGTIATPFASAGTGHVAARLDSGAVFGDPNLQLRVPTTLVDALGLVPGCTVTAARVPMWRFNATAQPSPYTGSQLTVSSCPPPFVVSAFAASGTSVRITFNRDVDPGSVQSADPFLFDNGLLAVSVAGVSGRTVTVQTTSQSVVTYTVTVANSVTDVYGGGVGVPNSAQFTGFSSPATLRLSEVNPAIASGRDLVELVATAAGSTNGIAIVVDPAAGGGGTVAATLPSIAVQVGDLVVVHFTPGAETDESVSKTQCVDAACYAGAWDVRGGASGLTFSNRVLALRAADGTTLLDAVAFTTSGGAPAAYPAAVQFVQGAGHWLPANCAGDPCTYLTTPTVEAIAVPWTGVGTSASGFSVARTPGTDTNSSSDWNAASTHSWGAPNP